MSSKTFRYYQSEANEAIYNELLTNNKCLVKMFCGTGKSLLMRNCKILQNNPFIVYVFPSLNLINQFYNDYLLDINTVLRVSSDEGSTTNGLEITNYLNNKSIPIKIICVTYQSFQLLLDNLNGLTINVCLFDEAHHVVGEVYQTLIFNNNNNVCEKQIFFTATPKNANGIVMYDRDHPETNMCGELAYDYPYLRGVNEGYLNPFEIRIDMFTVNTNKSLYETISRSILASGNTRVLTFHADVNTDRDASVRNFVNEKVFCKTFREILLNEFPDKFDNYKKVQMIALDASISPDKRRQILNKFDKTPDNQVFVISSCETIGEGIDTKNANMCVFVDPKSSYVKIIQNIGRIVRKVFGQDKPNSTVLIPCWVDKDKYIECDGDKDKCDEVIRQDMSEGGNFNGILNVLSALRQEDEDLYDICLHYPDTFSPQEIKGNLERQGYKVDDAVGEGGLMETCEHLLDCDLDYDEFEDCDTEEEMIMAIADNNDVCVEVHTNSLENPVERYNPEAENVIRLYKCEDREDENDTPVYQPIVKKDGVKKDKEKRVVAPDRKKRTNIKVHTNPDIKVLWKISSEISKDICSCILDCEVVDNWFERFEELKKFIDENERRPHISKDEKEKRLAYWLYSQTENYNNNKYSMKDNNKYNLWSIFLEEYKEYFISDEEKWQTLFDQLKQFINKNKKTPSSVSKNKEEKRLEQWLSSQLHKYKTEMKNKQQYEQLNEFLKEYKEYFLSFEKKWQIAFEQLKQFIDKNKKTPSQLSNNKEEKKLAVWLSGQQTKYKRKELTEDRYNQWAEFVEEYKEYLLNKEEIWQNKFEQLKQFINENKKRPSSTSKNAEEKKLGNWLSIKQKEYKNKQLTEDRYNQWTEFLEEYKEYLLSFEEIWQITFEQLKLFIDKNKKTPSSTSKNNEENSLGRWFLCQQTTYKKKQLTEDRYNQWTEFLEEYKEYLLNLLNKEEIWQNTFEQLKQFINKNKKRPLNGSKTKEEKILASWVSGQQTNYKKKELTEYRYNQWTGFVEDYKEYFINDEEKWQITFEQLKQFIDKNKKTPSSSSKNIEDKRLGSWLLYQQTNYKKKELTEDIYNQWTKFLEEYKEYLLNKEEIWQNTFEQLKLFINQNKKCPSQHSTNKQEKQLGSWLNQQKIKYKKKADGMKDETRYNQWTEFLEEYKQYFSKDTSTTDITNSLQEEEFIMIPKKSMTLKKDKKPKKETKENKESDKEKRERVKSELSVLHQKYKTLKSSNLKQTFHEDIQLWHNYHQISEDNEKSFPEDEIPRNRIIQELNKIKTKRRKLVVDMGCGKAHISDYYKDDNRFEFINYDHVAVNDKVIECDISNIPLEDDSVELCILSLAMWGSNCREYIMEADRILESSGKLYIIEPTKRWSEQDESGNIVDGKECAKLKNVLLENNFKIVEENIAKFSLFICIKM
jgi:superfamily II DNA or RNA helicase